MPAIKFAIHAGSESANGIEKPAGQFADREKTIFVLQKLGERTCQNN